MNPPKVSKTLVQKQIFSVTKEQSNQKNTPIPLNKITKNYSSNAVSPNTTHKADIALPDPKQEENDEGELEGEIDVISKIPVNVENVQNNNNSNEEREKLIDVRKHLNMYLVNKQKVKCENIRNESTNKEINAKGSKEIKIPLQEKNKNFYSESLASSQNSMFKKHDNSSQISQENNKKNYEEIFLKRREMLAMTQTPNIINSPINNNEKGDLSHIIVDSPSILNLN